MNTKTKEGARNKRNPYFLRVPWNKGGLVNTGPDISRLVTVISTLRDERIDILIQATIWVNTVAEATDDEENFNLVKKQYNSTEHLTVIKTTSIQSRGGVKQVFNQNCECPFFTNKTLPCKHIFALRKYNH